MNVVDMAALGLCSDEGMVWCSVCTEGYTLDDGCGCGDDKQPDYMHLWTKPKHESDWLVTWVPGNYLYVSTSLDPANDNYGFLQDFYPWDVR